MKGVFSKLFVQHKGSYFFYLQFIVNHSSAFSLKISRMTLFNTLSILHLQQKVKLNFSCPSVYDVCELNNTKKNY
jgi:hypothetical protein